MFKRSRLRDVARFYRGSSGDLFSGLGVQGLWAEGVGFKSIRFEDVAFRSKFRGTQDLNPKP